MNGLGIKVHSNIGSYRVTGVLFNGLGRTILLRADMDALQLREKTGLPYISRKLGRDENGNDTHITHGCGHNLHTTCLMAVTTLSTETKFKWSSNLMCLFQGDEEIGRDAQAIVINDFTALYPNPI